MTLEKLATLFLEVLILGVVLATFLRQPTDTPRTMPQTITHTFSSGSVTTPRNAGESMDDWLDRHQAAIDAAGN